VENGLLVANYLAGPEILRRTISGMTYEQLKAAPVPFKWSTREVVFHLADFDMIYADHMKRVIAENEPQLLGPDEKRYAARLAYDMRDVDEEVRLIKSIRRHMGRILRSIDADDFERRGIHSVHGSVTLAQLLRRAVNHIPHHAQYIEEKRRALKVAHRAIPFHLASAGLDSCTIA
jgi:uncharacterized damage-inducible protein DinB